MQAGVEAALPASLSEVRFAVVDVETSGLKSSSHRILQLGVVVVHADGTVLDRWHSYLRPRWGWLCRVGPRHVHGITRRDVVHAPEPGAVLAQLATRLDGAVLTAHNLDFDWAFLQRASRRAGCELPHAGRLCTLRLARSLVPTDVPPGSVSNRLADLCSRYGVRLHRAHDALADAEATAALLPHLFRDAGVTSSAQLAQIIER
jgi:DNA polymerase III subunit epsilon